MTTTEKAITGDGRTITLLWQVIIWSGISTAILSVIILAASLAGYLTEPGPHIPQPKATEPEPKPLEIIPLPDYALPDTITIRTFRKDRESFAKFVAAEVSKQGGHLLSQKGTYHSTYVVPSRYATELSNLATGPKGLPPATQYVDWANRQSKTAPGKPAATADTSVTVSIVSPLIQRPAVAWIIGGAGAGIGAMFLVFAIALGWGMVILTENEGATK